MANIAIYVLGTILIIIGICCIHLANPTNTHSFDYRFLGVIALVWGIIFVYSAYQNR